MDFINDKGVKEYRIIKNRMIKYGYSNKDIFDTKLFNYVVYVKKNGLINIKSGHLIFNKIVFSILNIYNEMDNYSNIYNLSQEDDIIDILNCSHIEF